MKEKVIFTLFILSLVVPSLYFVLFTKQPVHQTMVIKKIQSTTSEGRPRFFYITKDYGMKETSAEDFLQTHVYDNVEIKLKEESPQYKAVFYTAISFIFFMFCVLIYKQVEDD